MSLDLVRAEPPAARAFEFREHHPPARQANDSVEIAAAAEHGGFFSGAAERLDPAHQFGFDHALFRFRLDRHVCRRSRILSNTISISSSLSFGSCFSTISIGV